MTQQEPTASPGSMPLTIFRKDIANSLELRVQRAPLVAIHRTGRSLTAGRSRQDVRSRIGPCNKWSHQRVLAVKSRFDRLVLPRMGRAPQLKTSANLCREIA